MDVENRVDAVRYALLQRMAPAIRHGLVGKLHPISLLAESMGRRLRVSPEPEQIRDSLEKIAELARSAIAGCAGLTGWLTTGEDEAVALQEGVEDCLSLLGTDLGMRGHTVVSRLEGVDATVSKSAVRQVLAAILVAETDVLTEGADMELSAEVGSDHVILVIAVSPAQRSPAGTEEGGPVLARSDADLLARAEAVGVARREGRIELRFSLLPAGG